jgi:hypothetical protein
MTKNDFSYWVSSRDNYDPGDGWMFRAGFDTADEAIAHAKELVDKVLASGYKLGMAAYELIGWYSYGAEQPEVRSKESLPPAEFDVLDYVRMRNKAMCGDASVFPDSSNDQLKAYSRALAALRRKERRRAFDEPIAESKANMGEPNE